AALGAGVIGADVAALGAKAAGAIAFLARGDGAARDLGKTSGVDAARRLGVGEPGLGAEGQAHLVLGRDRPEFRDERAFLLGLRIAPGEAVAARRRCEIARALAVEVGKGDHDLVDAAPKGRGELAEPRAVRLERGQRGDQDRVVAPDRNLRPPLSPERLYLG